MKSMNTFHFISIKYFIYNLIIFIKEEYHNFIYYYFIYYYYFVYKESNFVKPFLSLFLTDFTTTTTIIIIKTIATKEPIAIKT